MEVFRLHLERELLREPAAQRALAELFVGEDLQGGQVETVDRFAGPGRQIAGQLIAADLPQLAVVGVQTVADVGPAGESAPVPLRLILCFER